MFRNENTLSRKTGHSELSLDLHKAMRVFVRVGKLNGFSAASRDLGISKSAVSRHVMELEGHLGVRLVNRNTRQVNLTEAGEIFARKCSAILDDIDALQNETKSLHQLPSGTLRVSALVTFGLRGIAPVIAGFLEQYPDISVDLSLTNRMVNVIEEGWDVAIRAALSPELDDSSLIGKKLTAVAMGVYASRDYLEKHGTPTTPEDLLEHICIAHPTENGMPRPWSFKSNGSYDYVQIKGRLLVNSVEVAATTAADGVGITCIPDFVVEEGYSSDLIKLLSDYQTKETSIYAIYPHKHLLSGKVRAFVDYLAETIE